MTFDPDIWQAGSRLHYSGQGRKSRSKVKFTVSGRNKVVCATSSKEFFLVKLQYDHIHVASFPVAVWISPFMFYFDSSLLSCSCLKIFNDCSANDLLQNMQIAVLYWNVTHVQSVVLLTLDNTASSSTIIVSTGWLKNRSLVTVTEKVLSISQTTVVTHLSCGGIFINDFTTIYCWD